MEKEIKYDVEVAVSRYALVPIVKHMTRQQLFVQERSLIL